MGETARTLPNLSLRLDDISGHVIVAALRVHSALGPGLLESAYHACLAHELGRRGLRVEQNVAVPIAYEDLQLPIGYRIDLLIERRVGVELKAVEQLHPVHTAQLLSYLRLSGYPLGLLLNFHAPRLKQGIRRVSNSPRQNTE